MFVIAIGRLHGVLPTRGLLPRGPDCGGESKVGAQLVFAYAPSQACFFVIFTSKGWPNTDLVIVDPARGSRSLYAHLKRLPDPDRVVADHMTRFGLFLKRTSVAHTLNSGHRRVLSVALATIGSPPVIILDSPTLGEAPGGAHLRRPSQTIWQDMHLCVHIVLRHRPIVWQVHGSTCPASSDD